MNINDFISLESWNAGNSLRIDDLDQLSDENYQIFGDKLREYNILELDCSTNLFIYEDATTSFDGHAHYHEWYLEQVVNFNSAIGLSNVEFIDFSDNDEMCDWTIEMLETFVAGMMNANISELDLSGCSNRAGLHVDLQDQFIDDLQDIIDQNIDENSDVRIIFPEGAVDTEEEEEDNDFTSPFSSGSLSGG